MRNLLWVWVVGLIILLDQLSKYWVVGNFNPGQAWEILPILDLLLVYNMGVAFSLLSDYPGLLTGFSMMMIVILVTWLVLTKKPSLLFKLGLVLIIGGALGNLLDRLSLGMVIDFIHCHWGVYSWPIFNVADMAICIGAGCLMVTEFTGPV